MTGFIGATSFKYRNVTANCGNDAIGTVASTGIVKLINEDTLDFVVINCQEVDFEKTQKQLEASLQGGEYTVTCVGKMPTHTKLSTQLHNNTGIGTFVIHRKNLQLRDITSHEARRGKYGSGFNKGGLVTNLSLGYEDGSSGFVKVQTISAHLDSSNASKRTQDWGVVHKKIAKSKGLVDSFSQLEAAFANIELTGYDANTRNKYNDGNAPDNIWNSKQLEELSGFFQAPLGAARFSAHSTYKTHKEDIRTVEDAKRPGKTRGGMLVFADISTDSMRFSDSISTDGVVVFQADEGTARDHSVVASPKQEYVLTHSDSDSFKRVVNNLAIRLEACAPKLVERIQDFKGTVAEKDQLVTIYNQYLTEDGFLNKQLDLHAQSLKVMAKIEKKLPGFSESKEEKSLKSFLYRHSEPWFEQNGNELNNDEIQSAQQRQEAVLKVLKACKTLDDVRLVSQKVKEYSDDEQFNKATQDILARQFFMDPIYELVNDFKSSIKALFVSQSSPQAEVEMVELKVNLVGKVNDFVDEISKVEADCQPKNSYESTMMHSFVASVVSYARACVNKLAALGDVSYFKEKAQGILVDFIKNLVQKMPSSKNTNHSIELPGNIKNGISENSENEKNPSGPPKQ